MCTFSLAHLYFLTVLMPGLMMIGTITGGCGFTCAARCACMRFVASITAEKVFGWKNVHKHEGALVGKRQDKAGRWRLAKVPNYSTNPLHSNSVENRMKQLGRMDQYEKELSKITRSKNIPSDWASPDQRCRAAIKAVGQYGQVIPLRKSGGES